MLRGTRIGTRRRAHVPPALEGLEQRLLLTLNPTGLEQELLEWTQLFRSDTQGHLDDLFTSLSPLTSPDWQVQSALDYFGVDATQLQAEWLSLTDAPPLAWNENLMDAAYSHSQLMIQYDEQSHQLPGESPSLTTRFASFGYTSPGIGVGENAYAYGESAYYAHSGFAVDWGEENPVVGAPDGMQDPAGHRDNLTDGSWKEVGFAVIPENDPDTGVGPLVVTQEFGYRSNMGNPFLLGVVWDDTNANGYYTAGEGYAGVTVRVLDAQSQVVATTTTMDAGGWQVQVPAGTYTVEFSGGALGGTITQPATVATDNVKVDATPDMIDGIALADPGYGATVAAGSAYLLTWSGGAADKTLDLYEYGPAGCTALAADYASQTGSYSWNTQGRPLGYHLFVARVKTGGVYEPGPLAAAHWLEVTSAPPAPLSAGLAPLGIRAESTSAQAPQEGQPPAQEQGTRHVPREASPIGSAPVATEANLLSPVLLPATNSPAQASEDTPEPQTPAPPPAPLPAVETNAALRAALEGADEPEYWFAPIL